MGNEEIAELIKQQHLTPIASSIEIDKLNQESQKNTENDLLNNKSKKFLKNFNKKKEFLNLMKDKDFLDIVFGSKFSLDNTVPKSFFQHIIENNEFIAKFCDGLSENKKITLDFVKKAIEYSDMPFAMLKILIVNIFIFNLQLLENSSVAKWVDENFKKLEKADKKEIQHEIACIILNGASQYYQIWILCLLDLFKLQKTLFFPVLFSKILATRINETKITPLYSLTENENKGIKLLSYFVDQNEDVLVNIPSKVWKKFLVNSNGTNTDMNPLINLINKSDGVEVFNKFLKSKSFGPILIEIYIELCNTMSNNRCSLLWFTIAQNGTEVIKTIIDYHGDKIKNFSIKSWTFLTENSQGLDIYSRRSAIFELTTTDEGLIVLEMLINKHYNIIEKISHDTWGVKTGNKGNMSSALYNLVKSEKGLKILEILIERKNNIINLPLSAWTDTVTETKKMTMIFKNTGESIFNEPKTLMFSALDYLLQNIEEYPDKGKILNELKEVYGNDFGNQSALSIK